MDTDDGTYSDHASWASPATPLLGFTDEQRAALIRRWLDGDLEVGTTIEAPEDDPDANTWILAAVAITKPFKVSLTFRQVKPLASVFIAFTVAAPEEA